MHCGDQHPDHSSHRDTEDTSEVKCEFERMFSFMFYSFMSGLRDEELEPSEEVDQLPKFGFDGKRLDENNELT